MTLRSAVAVLGLATGLAACRGPAPLVPVVGPKTDVAALTGHWSGEYISQLTGRGGTIDLTVSGQGDSASGVVLMIPAGFGQPLEPWLDPELDPALHPALDPALEIEARAPTPAPLTIQFIRVEGNNVSGVMAPYADPQTGDRLITSFAGRLAGDTIAGTFLTHPGPAPGGETGRWIVTRQHD